MKENDMSKRAIKVIEPKQYMDDYIEEVMKRRLGVLFGRIPEHAIKTREGRGGRTFRYVTHGYVKSMLNQAFGLDWDFRLLPVFNGNIYILNTVTSRKMVNNKWIETQQRNIAVYGELTVRVRDMNGNLLTTITRPGAGSQDWGDNTEFGDALKGAESDAIKVAASTLGRAFGLQLYWDDELEREKAQEQKYPTPVTLAELISSVRSLGLDIDDVLIDMGSNPDDDIKAEDFSVIWQKAIEMAKAETSSRFVADEQ